jgi:hypothetical protein
MLVIDVNNKVHAVAEPPRRFPPWNDVRAEAMRELGFRAGSRHLSVAFARFAQMMTMSHNPWVRALLSGI